MSKIHLPLILCLAACGASTHLATVGDIRTPPAATTTPATVTPPATPADTTSSDGWYALALPANTSQCAAQFATQAQVFIASCWIGTDSTHYEYVWHGKAGLPERLPAPTDSDPNVFYKEIAVLGMNSSGVMVGTANKITLNSYLPIQQAVRWTPNSTGGWVVDVIPPPQGATKWAFTGIDSAGNILADLVVIDSDNNATDAAVLISASGGTTQLIAPVPGYGIGAADYTGLNDAGQFLTFAGAFLDDDSGNAGVYDNGAVQSVSTPGAPFTYVLKMAGNGTVLAQAAIGDHSSFSNFRAAIFDKSSGSWAGQLLPQLFSSATNEIPYAMNATGAIVGSSTVPTSATSNDYHLVVWKTDHTPLDLGTVPARLKSQGLPSDFIEGTILNDGTIFGDVGVVLPGSDAPPGTITNQPVVVTLAVGL